MTTDQDLIDAARRVRDTRVEATPDEPPPQDPTLAALFYAGLIRYHHAPPIPDKDWKFPPDRWVLSDHGLEWLAAHEQENAA